MSVRSALSALALIVGCEGATPGQGTAGRLPTTIDVGFPASAVVAADLDRDGHLDVAVSGRSRLRILRGDGTGALNPLPPLPAGDNAEGLAVGDLNADGWPDLVGANHETDYLTLVYGGPEGHLEEAAQRLRIEVDPHPHAVAVRDLDGDGHTDLLVDDRGAGALQLLRGDGAGGFAPGVRIDVGGDPYRGFAVADLDGDGDLDLVAPGPRTVNVVRNEGGGRMVAWAQLEPPGFRPFSVAVTDIDDDGRADIGAGSGEEAGVFALWLGQADGRFEPAPDSPWRLDRGPTSVTTGDLGGDGLTEFLVSSWSSQAVRVLHSGPGERSWVHVEVGRPAWSVATADLDGNGGDEVILADKRQTTIRVLWWR